MRCEAMVRSDDSEREREIWGTWEELLLACAVNRHGTRCWNSVVMEVRSRSPSHNLLTPENCKHRYLDLQRRFSAGCDEIDGEEGVSEAVDGESAAVIPWLEELRKLRVAELRREVQSYDISIGSLQLKVKKLKEDHDRSLRDAEAGEEGPDLKREDEIKDRESPGSRFPGDRISGGDSDSGRSCKESNSTDPKEEEARPVEAIREPEPASVAGDGADPVPGGDNKSAGEASYNGSSETIAKNAASSPAAEVNPVGDSGESVAESKGGETEGAKESSDVQSSASLSRRRRGRRRKTVSVSSSGGEEPEADAVSPVRKPFAVESQPLVAFLEIIRSHEYEPIFTLRLESQESVRYRSLIRRHVDLEMVRSKIGAGGYTIAEFFRDLLLFCNNAIVFHAKDSPESIAAVHLRDLVNKEMARTTRKPPRPPPPPAKEPTSPPLPPPQPPPIAPNLKPDADHVTPSLEKPASMAPLVACRKRSSISAKAAAATMTKVERDEKPDLKEKEPEKDVQDKSVDKKRTKERSAVPSTRGLRSNKSRGNTGNSGGSVVKSENPVPTPNRNRIPAANTAEAEEKTERKTDSGGGAAAKKRSVANFLNRMKRSSPSSTNGTLLETLKGSSPGSGGGKVTEQKKGVRGDGRKDQVLRQGSGSGTVSKRPPPEQSVPVKRSVGRPPKRAPPPAIPTPAKRLREEAEPPPARKRGRR